MEEAVEKAHAFIHAAEAMQKVSRNDEHGNGLCWITGCIES